MSDHPLAIGGSSAIEAGPWHYGADYVAVYFEADKRILGSLVPKPFTVKEGKCMAYVCEIVSVSDKGRRVLATNPERTRYQEAAVGIGCSYEGRKGIFFPVMWVTTEWALLRGLVNGYQKRLAESIVLTRVHPLNPGIATVAPGSEFGAYCVKGGERVLSVEVRVNARGEPSELPNFGVTYGMRHFPSTDSSQVSVTEAVEVIKSGSRTSDVWLGTGELETTLAIGRAKMTGAAVYKSGFTIQGSRVLARL